MSEKSSEKFQRHRIPRTFKDVARVLHEIRTDHKSLKSAVYASKCRGRVLKKIYGIASSVFKNMPALNYIAKEIEFSSEKFSMSEDLFNILVHEIISQHPLPGESRPVLLIQEHRPKIEEIYLKFRHQNKLESNTFEFHVPKYARIQTSVTTVDDVIKALHQEGYSQKPTNHDASLESYHKDVKSLKIGEFMQDWNFSDLLIFSKDENLVDWHLYKNGHIFLQDKASYIPVYALNPAPGSIVLDCCAAPGMKTTHLACMMKNTGHIYAIDKDPTRLKVLEKVLRCGSVTNCTYFCEDFTNIKPNKAPYCSVQYILLDPSCSGSGMIERTRYSSKDTFSSDKSRIEKLARFQITLLKHALSFPSVQRIVYSTCSIHEEENECVVEEALSFYSGVFKVIDAFPEWPTRGLKKYKIGSLCVRAFPKENLTKGFFVAIIDRINTLPIAETSRIDDISSPSARKKRRISKNKTSQNFFKRMPVS